MATPKKPASPAALASSLLDRWAQFEFEAELPKELKPGGAGTSGDPVQLRRDTMASSIDLQVKLWQDPKYTEERTTKEGKKQVRPREWWKMNGELFYLTPRYGTRFFKVRQDAPVVKLKSAQVELFLKALKEAVMEGEFDGQMEELARRKRT